MGERKLNFNVPLMSVRRFSSPSASANRGNGKIIENPTPSRRHTLPIYRSDLNLDQVTEPVAVPFNWEQIPGRAKDGSGPKPQPPEEACVTPRLPPGRFSDISKQPFEKEYEDTNRFRSQNEAYSSNDNAIKLECSKDGINEKEGLDLEEDDDDDVYSDALDTLSPTNSFSMNCSASGLSGSDVPDWKPSGTFSIDPQTRDFMMRRFLPAAKAMTLEAPQYAPRKQGVPLEQPRQVNRVFSEDRRPLLNPHGSDKIPQFGQYKEEEESEEENDEYDEPNNISAKGCGLFPRLCFKNSLFLLSPVPGMKVRTQSPLSSPHGIVRPGKNSYIRSQSQTPPKHAWKATAYKPKLEYGVRSGELQRIENTQTGESNRFTHSCELKTTSRLSPYRRSWGAGVSPYRNEASHSPFRGVGFLGVPKEVENVEANRFNLYNEGSKKFPEVFSHQIIKQGSGSMSPVVEKTLYVDTVNRAETSFSNSSSSDPKGWMDSTGEDFETSLESRGLEETTSAESVFQDIKCLNFLKGSVDADQSSMPERSHVKGRAVMMEGFGQDQGLDKRSSSLECSEVTTDGNLNINNDHILKADDPGNFDDSFVQSHVPPPLPKSPSESWLWRTLPPISSRIPLSHSNLGTQVNSKRQDSKTSSTSTKWETIVKTSHLHHDHVRYSEELITHVSQQSKT